MTSTDRWFWRGLIVLFLVSFSALAAYGPQYTVSLYKSTTKVKDLTGATQQAAWDACYAAAAALQPTTTSKVSCKTPVLSLAVVPDPPPPPTLGSATLTWPLVTQNTDGSTYADPFGYVVNYGTSPTDLSQFVDVNDPNATTYIVSGLTSGTWYFCIKARNTSNVRSDCSPVVSKTL